MTLSSVTRRGVLSVSPGISWTGDPYFPDQHDYINPMDINLDYADDDDPLSLKSDFILSLCELVVGGKNGLEPVEKTVIDRCVRLVYQDFLSDPVPEKNADLRGFI